MGAFIIYSLMKNEISFLTWLVVFGYYLGDTTTTTLIRIILVKKWYHPHRSHAYQNLARILDSHAIVSFWCDALPYFMASTISNLDCIKT